MNEAAESGQSGFGGLVDDIGMRVVDPLNADILVGRVVFAGVGLDLGGSEVVDALDVDLLQLRLLRGRGGICCAGGCEGGGLCVLWGQGQRAGGVKAMREDALG